MPLKIYGPKNKCAALICNLQTENYTASLCRTHRQRRSRHILEGRQVPSELDETEIAPNPKLRKSFHRDSQGRKKCTQCSQYKSESEYSKGAPLDGLTSACKGCTALRVRLHKYRLSARRYWLLWERQQGNCAICVRPLAHSRREAVGDLQAAYVDHDHSCCPANDRTCGNCIRGLLCQGCNTALGHLREDIPTMLRAIEYVKSDFTCPA